MKDLDDLTNKLIQITGNKLNIYLNHSPPENGVLTCLKIDEKNGMTTSFQVQKSNRGDIFSQKNTNQKK